MHLVRQMVPHAVEPVTLDELESSFGSLALAAVTATDFLDNLVASNVLLAKTNAQLSTISAI